MFWGDIKFNSFWPSPKMNELQAGTGVVFGRTLNPAFKLSSELNFTVLKGMQEVLPDTISFKTQALSFALKGQINPLFLLTKRESKFAIYLEAGAGIMVWRSLVENVSTSDTINNLGWSNPNKELGFYIPAGIKLEYQISQKLSTYFISHYNFVFSDLLDGAATGNNDRSSFTALGINYHFGKQKVIPKLLPYNFFEIAYDSLTAQSSKKEKKALEEAIEESINPFSISYKVPETAPHTGFEIQVDIAKIGIPATGFFRLLIPSGFIPQSSTNENVSFTKLGHRYEYDFILPMNEDSASILIPVKLSEIEKGTFPVLIEGEIMDQKGNVFPIKFASYTEIVSEDTWYKGLPIKEQEKFDAKKTDQVQKENVAPEYVKGVVQSEEEIKPKKQTESSEGVYRIQIMASRKQFADLATFKTKHRITQNIFISENDGWYRYNLYATTDQNEASRLCAEVRQENKIPQAFVTYYKNGKRVLSPVNRTLPNTKSGLSSASSSRAKEHKSTPVLNNKLLYRIEIAIAYDKPIPLYLLKNKVGKEPISEFEHDSSYYYTLGEFENLEVARAFLDYVKTQFEFETAKIGQYQNNKRVKTIF